MKILMKQVMMMMGMVMAVNGAHQECTSAAHSLFSWLLTKIYGPASIHSKWMHSLIPIASITFTISTTYAMTLLVSLKLSIISSIHISLLIFLRL